MRSLITSMLLALASFHQSSLAAPANPITPDSTTLSVQTRKVFDLPLGVWAENLNTKQNGQVLITIASQPEIYQVSPYGNQDGVLIHRFYGYQSVFAIVQTQKDLFYASVGNWSLTTFTGTRGSWNIWEIDLRGVGTNRQISECQIRAQSQIQTVPSIVASSTPACATPIVRRVAELPQITFPDGMDVLNTSSGTLITGDADSQNGQLYTINVNTGLVTPTYTNIGLGNNISASNLLGIDGIKYLNNTLYYSNPSRSTFGKVPLSSRTGQATGNLAVLYKLNSTLLIDDFNFDHLGNLYSSDITDGLQYAKHRVGSSSLMPFAQEIPGTTATMFGKGPGQKTTLFVTNNGGLQQWLDDNFTSAGGLWAVDVAALVV